MKLLKSFLLVVCVPTLVLFFITLGILYQIGTIVCEAEDKDLDSLQWTMTYRDFPFNGIDISHHNGIIDWKRVSKVPLQFVYIKATEGSTFVDKMYRQNVDSAHRYGLNVGAYHYFRATSTPQQQFNNFKKVVKKADLNLIPCIDVETPGLKQYQGNVNNMTKDVFALATLMEEYYGVKPLLYFSPHQVDEWLHEEAAKRGYLIWKYPAGKRVGKNDNYVLFQYGGASSGSIPGINSRIDLNYIDNDNEIEDIKYGKR